MTYQEKKEISELAAKLNFEARFMHKMKNKDIKAFKKDYRTLYNEVIIPLIAEQRLLAESFNEANTRLDRDLKKYIELKEVIQNMIDRLDEGGEMTLTKDNIIVLALKEAIQ